MERLVI